MVPGSLGIVKNDGADNLENALVAALSVTVLVRLKCWCELQLGAQVLVKSLAKLVVVEGRAVVADDDTRDQMCLMYC